MGDLLVVSRYTQPEEGVTSWLPNNRQLTPAEVLGIATIYWGTAQAPNALKIAEAESGLWTGAWATWLEDSRGLWQINVNAWPAYCQYALEDPQICAYFAYQIWKSQGWCPWSTAKALGLCP